jgi:hypothetical protein
VQQDRNDSSAHGDAKPRWCEVEHDSAPTMSIALDGTVFEGSEVMLQASSRVLRAFSSLLTGESLCGWIHSIWSAFCGDYVGEFRRNITMSQLVSNL